MKLKLLLTVLLISSILQSQEIPVNMVMIPAGEFNMGKNTGNPTDWQPEHKVTIDTFFMDQVEVTNKQGQFIFSLADSECYCSMLMKAGYR